MSRSRLQLLLACLSVVTGLVASSCGKKEETAPPVATPSVTLNHDRAPAGSPLEITYKFVAANDAKFAEDYRVFLHVVDTDEEQMWTDDHNPPIPTSQWKAGQTVEYTRTIFVPVFPYVGDASLQIGLHSTKNQERLALNAQDVGKREYRIAHVQLLPQTDNLFTVFKDGWHPSEAASQTPSQDNQEWQWTKKMATLAFKNPKKDAVLYLDLDSPAKDLHGPQQVQVMMGGDTVETFMLPPDERLLKKIRLSGSKMGEGDLAELQIVVDQTFTPSVLTNGASRDPRELGVRVFHAFVDPR
jgi:hypothetical protein